MIGQRVEDATIATVKWKRQRGWHELWHGHWQTRIILFTANTESQSMKKITRYIDQLTNKITPNDPAQTRTRHQDDDQVTLSYSSTAVPSSSFSTRPGSSTPTASHSKALLISRVHHRIGKKSTNGRRCTSFAQFPVTIVD